METSTSRGGRFIARGDYVWTGTELIADGAVAWTDGVIEAVGPWSELRKTRTDAEIVGGVGRMVLPGLINAHHHGNGLTSFVRGVPDDHLEPWLAGLRGAPAADPDVDARLAALDALHGGYTTMVLFQSTGRPDRAMEEAVARIDAVREVGLRVAFGLDVTQRNFYVYGPDPEGVSPRQALRAEEYVALLDELSRRYGADPFVKVFAAPSGPEWVTDDTWIAVGEWTRRRGAPLHTHALESPLQAEFARREFEGGLAAHLDRLGALHGGTALVHGVFLDEGAFDLMAERGAHLITNPGSNLRLRCGVSPVLLALERGVNVALGTDGFALGDRDDGLAEMRLLFYLQRGVGLDTPALTWEQALAAATTGAAGVTGWADEIGKLAPGRLADLSLFDFARAAGPWRHPDVDPLHVLLHRGGREHVDAVVVGGRIVRDGARGALLVDEGDVFRRAKASMDEAAQKRGLTADRLAEEVVAYYRRWLAGPP